MSAVVVEVSRLVGGHQITVGNSGSDPKPDSMRVCVVVENNTVSIRKPAMARFSKPSVER